MDVVVEIVLSKFQSRSDVLPVFVKNIRHLVRTIGKMEQPDIYEAASTQRSS